MFSYMAFKRQAAEVPLEDVNRMRRFSITERWLHDGPVHIQGVLDIITAYSQEFEGICLLTLEGHTYGVSSLAALPDGKLVSGSYDNTIRVWDVSCGTCLLTLAGASNDAVTALAVLPDGKLASGSQRGKVRLWLDGVCLLTLAGHRV